MCHQGRRGLGAAPKGLCPAGTGSSLGAGLSHGSLTFSRAPTLARLPLEALRSPRHQASFLPNPAAGQACWERRDPFSLHPHPLPYVFSAGEPCPLAVQAQRHTEVVKEADTQHTQIDTPGVWAGPCPGGLICAISLKPHGLPLSSYYPATTQMRKLRLRPMG